MMRGARMSSATLAPVETLMTSYMTFGSRPALAPITKASAMATVLTWISMLLTSLRARPWPMPPTWNWFDDMALNIGRQAS